MARLSQLAGNLWIVFPPTVTIAVLFALFQQGLSQFNFTTQFFRTGTEQHPAQFFYLSPQMFYFPFIFFDLKWSTKTGHRVRVFPVSIFRFVWG
ncbi:hypothetical protein BvCmsHHNP008_01179 [Escherichia coli]|nr:hypothetical protein BvCmsHHNP008_01179 [Escherichia coli]GDI95284.1 hypothetical protein BvCmsKKNP025_04286 [Escherichia coli]GDM95616.1 hypothetical protein BvCmsNSNP014_04567 [Escherichia coli]